MKTIKTYEDFVNEEINLRKGLMGAALATSLMGGMTSCNKEDIEPITSTPAPSCNCGTIVDDDIVFDTNNNMYYSLTIKNDCSGNLGTYYFSREVWMTAYVGNAFCITNVSSWLAVEGDFDISKRVDVVNKEIQ